MNKFPWRLGVSRIVVCQVLDMMDDRVSSLDVMGDYREVLLAFGETRGEGLGLPAGRWPLVDIPPPRLRIAAPGFAPDFVQLIGFYYVSAAFRAAAERAGANVQYVPVDMTDCPPEAHAKDYKVLNVINPAISDEAEGPLALQVVGPRFLRCTDAFATAMLRAELEGVEIYDPITMMPARPSAT